MALIGEMQYLTIGGSTYSIPIGTTVEVERNLTSGTKSATIKVDGTSYDLYAPTPNAGTVTSVRVQATSPVQSSTSTAQSSSLNTTISLANGYGDTKNPYGTKTKNYVLAGPTTGNDAAPTFRALVAADIPDLSGTYLTSYTETDPTVPDWAKADSKPSYTAAEVGALPKTGGTITTNGLSIYGSLPSATQGAHVAIGNGTIRITGQTSSSYPSVTLAANNSGLYISSNGNAVKIQHLATPTSNTDAATKKYVDDSVNAISIPTKTSDLTNDSGFLTSHQDISGKADKSSTVSNITYDSTSRTLKKTINGTTSDVVDFGTAAFKLFTDSISNTSTNLPTSAAVASFVEGKGYLTSYTETDPIFTASAAAGITATDISNWNSIVSDDKTWNGVSLTTGNNVISESFTLYVPVLTNSTGTSARTVKAVASSTKSTSANNLVRYDANGYLVSRTTSANDNSTKVATTAYVDAAIPDISGFVSKSGDTMTGNLAFANDTYINFTVAEVTALNTPERLISFKEIGQSGAGNAAYTNFAFSVGPSTQEQTIQISGVHTPTGNDSTYNSYIASKKYVDDNLSSIVIPTSTGSSTTGISIADHSSTTIYGVQSSTTSVTGVSGSTTASKVTVSTSSTDYGITAAGSGSATLTFTMDTTDNKKLKITFSHTHTAPTLGSKVPTVSASNVTVPIAAASATTVPIKNASSTTVITSKTHTITDNGHTHTI